jgi:hypothetical protein
MPLISTKDPARVIRLAEALVAADPVAHTVFASIASAVTQDDAAAWAAHPAGASSILAARSQPHTLLVFTAGWTGLAEVGGAVASLDPPAAGLAGPPETVTELVARLPFTVTARMDERLFRLDELTAPPATTGSARLAGEQDAPWLARWYTEFAVEAFGRTPPGFDAGQMVQRGVARSRCWIWCDAAGQPVSFAVAHPPVGGVARIGPVYTPPALRGHGFASSVTAAASRDILDAGDIACLYTDLANPTSNRIYQALGYRRVLDRMTVRFD